MAYLHRVIFSALMLLASWMPTSSFASFAAVSACPNGSCTVYGTQIMNAPSSGQSSPAAACAAAQAAFTGTVYKPVVTSNTATNCYFNIIDMSDGSVFTTNYSNIVATTVQPSLTCPANSTLSGSTCSCNSGFTEGAGSCTSTTDVIVNALNFVGAPLIGTGPASLTACYQGITVRGTGGTATPNGSHNEVYGPFTSDGTPCTPTTDNAKTQSDCPAHSVRGTVNGVSLCSPAGDTNSVAAGPTLAASSPSGAASAPTLGGGAPAGATGSETGTSCSGEKCTTTTKFKDSSGATLGTTTKDEPKINFCNDNPESTICQKSSISVGSCGTVPACSGDAIQCAVAAQTFKMACSLAPDPGQETAAYDAAKGLTGNQTTNLPGNNTINISAGSFDQSEFLGAAVGVQDLTVTVAHKLITLPLSQVNIWLSRLGSLLQAVTFLVCLKIVTREA